MLRVYLPALDFIVLGAGLGAFFVMANSVLGPKPRHQRSCADPYDCGVPSDARVGTRMNLHFYLVGRCFSSSASS